MAGKSYVVKAQGVQPTLETGALATLLQQGAAVPSNADPAWIKHALDFDLIEEGKFEGGLVVRAGDGSDLGAVPDAGGTSSAPSPRQSSYDGTSAPAKSASKADWLDWAQKVEGVVPESDEGKALGEKTRDELAETYADKTPAA